MLLLLLICIIVLEARSVSLKRGENDRGEIVVCVLSLVVTALFFINWNTGISRKVLLVDFYG